MCVLLNVQVVDAKRIGNKGRELWLIRVPSDVKTVCWRERREERETKSEREREKGRRGRARERAHTTSR